MKLLSLSVLLFIKISFLPSVPLLFYMGIAILLDFVTGVAKSKLQGVARTSAGYRKTIIKFLQYGGALAVGIVLANIGDGQASESFKILLTYFNEGLIIFIIYIEVTSIFENLFAIDNKTLFSRYFIAPALKLLTWQIKNNPVVKAADKQKNVS